MFLELHGMVCLLSSRLIFSEAFRVDGVLSAAELLACLQSATYTLPAPSVCASRRSLFSTAVFGAHARATASKSAKYDILRVALIQTMSRDDRHFSR